MSPQAGWLLVNEIVPRLRSSIPGAVRLTGTEDTEELVQDGTAIAAQLLHSAEEHGKSVTAGNIAHFALKNLQSGRRSTGFRVTDPLHPAAQLAGRCRVHSLDEPLSAAESGDEAPTLGETLACRHDDPGVEASRRVDWDALEGKLDSVAKAILAAMVAGHDLTSLVSHLGKSRSTVQNHKNRLALAIKEALGSDIVALVQERVSWRANLDTGRERQSCRWDRRAA